jgi:SAM-dependent methyltransferase
MDDVTRSARAQSFGAVAGIYERGRPGYPDDAVRWLVGEAPARVVDVGAGTGKLTRQLVRLGHDVVAVDPSPGMLGQLRAVLPDVPALAGTAESIPLPDASADVVTFAQSWHWVDLPRAAAEVARVLRPGGRIGLVWNLRDDEDGFGARLSELIGSEDAHAVGPPADEDPGLPEPFGPAVQAIFRFDQVLTKETLIDLVASRSYVAILSTDDRQRLLDNVAALYDEFAVHGEVTLRYVTQ